MPKMKTHSSAKKRFAALKSGKFRRYRAAASHLLEHKSPTQRRRNRKSVLVSPADRWKLERLLPNG
jgi:large subunit ribosomal protein L35